MKFKIKKPWTNEITGEEYEAEQIVEMTVARALTAAEKLAAFGGGFIEVVEEEQEQDQEQPPKNDLTVAELKEELDKRGIDYPSDAKKADLVALFEGEGGEE